MENKYKYFTRSFFAEIFLSAVFTPILFLMWGFLFYYYHYVGAFSIPIFRASVYVSILYIFSRIFYGNTRIIANGKSIIINGENIIKKSGNTEQTITGAQVTGAYLNSARHSVLSQISGACFLRNLILGQRLILQCGKEKFDIPLCVHNGVSLIEQVFEKLSSANIMEKDALDAVKKKVSGAAFVCGLRYNLRMSRINKLLGAVAAAALLSAVTAVVFWNSSILSVLFWTTVFAGLQILAYFVAEFFHIKSVKNRRDKKVTENYAIAGLIAMFAGMVLTFVF